MGYKNSDRKIQYRLTKYLALIMTVVLAFSLIYQLITIQPVLLIIANFLLLVLSLIIYKLLVKLENLQAETFELEDKITHLQDDLAEKLSKARNVHRKILPNKIPEPETLTISTFYQPAEFMGGDYYNIFQIDHGSMSSILNQYLIYYFDVSGHGIDSTLLSIFINDTLENYFKLKHNPGEKVDPGEIMNYIDLQYQNEGFPDDYIVCLFLGLLDLNSYKLNYASAGMQFPLYLIDKDKGLEKIEIGGLPLSTGLGAVDSRPAGNFKLPENHTLLLSTDGLFEQRHNSKMYQSRAEEILQSNKSLPAPFIKDALVSDFHNFSGSKFGDDDVTFMLVERPEGKIKKWQLSKSRENSWDEIWDEIIDNIEDLFVSEDINSHEKPDPNPPVALIKLLERMSPKLKDHINAGEIDIKLNLLAEYITITLEENTGEVNLQNLLDKQRNSNLSQFRAGDSSNLTGDKIYYSYNEFYNKLYLLILR